MSRVRVKVEAGAGKPPRAASRTRTRRRGARAETSQRPATHRVGSIGASAKEAAYDPRAAKRPDLELRLDQAAESETATAEADAPAPATAQDEAASDAARPPEAPEEVPSPKLTLPELPATELSAEQLAARQAELAAARAALAGAGGPGETVGAFADAPPSVKAAAQANLDRRIGRQVRREHRRFAEGLPDFHAEMGGAPLAAHEGVPEIAAPSPDDVEPEMSLAPALQPEVPLLSAPAPFLDNEGLPDAFDLWYVPESSQEERAEAIGRTLAEVKTTDAGIDASAGPPLKLVRQGETDPGEIDAEAEARRFEVRGRLDEAARGVLDGPGPERVDLRQMDETYEVDAEALARPEIAGTASAAGAGRFLAMELPEEVSARFDQDHHAAMRDHLADARERTEDAEGERDRRRASALDEAEAQRRELVEGADETQRREVLASRQAIQAQRQDTLDAQAREVRRFEDAAESERRSSGKKVRDRIAADEKKIADRYDAVEEENRRTLRQGEADAEAERQKAKKASKKRSWWQRAKGWVKDRFADLKAAIGRVIDGVRNAIRGALNRLRNWAKRQIDRLASFVKGAIAAFGRVMKVLVDQVVGLAFPELAKRLNAKIDAAVEAAQRKVDEVAEELKKKVDEVVDGLVKALDAVLDFFQKAINFALAVLEAAITGDWSAVGRMILEAVLGVLGIDPEEFYAFVGRVLGILSDIIDDPGAFLGNAVGAVRQGFQRFADNFLGHLKVGVIAWLTGTLRGIEIPKTFDLMGVLQLGRQVLGLTWDWVRKRARKVVGERNVERLESLYEYVDELRREGWGALFGRVRDQLTGLVGVVLGQIKEYLVTQIVIGFIKWIASLFSPVGALVKLVFTIWNLFVFIRDQLTRIAGVIQAVVSAIPQIVKKVLEVAAATIEGALARALPTAIGLLAALLDLRGVPARVRKVLRGIRKRLARAIDRLLKAVARRFKGRRKGRPRKGRREKTRKKGRRGFAAPARIGRRLPVKAHTLLFHVVAGRRAALYLHSTARNVHEWLDFFAGRLKATKASEVRDTFPTNKSKRELKASLTATRKRVKRANKDAGKLLALEAKHPKKLTARDKARLAELKDGDASVLNQERQVQRDLKFLFKHFGEIDVARLDSAEATEQLVMKVFGEQIRSVHPFAREPLKSALKLHYARWSKLTWPEIKGKLEAKVNPFAKPFALHLGGGGQTSEFGSAAQDAVRKRIRANPGSRFPHPLRKRAKDGQEAETGARGDEILTDFLSNHLAPHVHGSQGKHGGAALLAARKLVYTNKSRKNDFKKLAARIDDAVSEKWEQYRTRGAAPSEEFEAVLAGMPGSNDNQRVLAFLHRMAAKRTAYSQDKTFSIKWDEFEEKVWKVIPNRDKVRDAFLDPDTGHHEFIPRENIDAVIARAQKDPKPKSLAAGIGWSHFQDNFRLPTVNVIFRPDLATRGAREVLDPVTVPYLRDPRQPRKGGKDQVRGKAKNVTVLQGHPGAVYAPLKKGKYVDQVKPQTAGSGKWHDWFSDRFKDVVKIDDSSYEQMWRILREWQQQFEETVWDGKSPRLANPPFREYYVARADHVDPANLMELSALTANAEASRDVFERAYERAVKAVPPKK